MSEILRLSSEPFIHDDNLLDEGLWEEDWSTEDEYEYWIAECGQGQEYDGCLKAGSEECDWECPFHDDLYDFHEETRLQAIGWWILNKLPSPGGI